MGNTQEPLCSGNDEEQKAPIHMFGSILQDKNGITFHSSDGAARPLDLEARLQCTCTPYTLNM